MNSVPYRPRTYIRTGRETHAVEEYLRHKLNPNEPRDPSKILGTDEKEENK